MSGFRTTGIYTIDAFLAGGLTSPSWSLSGGGGAVYCMPPVMDGVTMPSVHLATDREVVAREMDNGSIEVFEAGSPEARRIARLVVGAFGLLYEPEAITIPPLLVQAWRAWRGPHRYE